MIDLPVLIAAYARAACVLVTRNFIRAEWLMRKWSRSDEPELDTHWRKMSARTVGIEPPCDDDPNYRGVIHVRDPGRTGDEKWDIISVYLNDEDLVWLAEHVMALLVSANEPLVESAR